MAAHTARRRYNAQGRLIGITCKQGDFETNGKASVGVQEAEFRQHRKDKGETVIRAERKRLSLDLDPGIFDDFARLAAAHGSTSAKFAVELINRVTAGEISA